MASVMTHSASSASAPEAAPRRAPLSLDALHRRLGVLRWLAPLGLLLLVVLYELGPARWIDSQFGGAYRVVGGILMYGTVGPVLAFLSLRFLDRWLEERQTSELQAQVLARAREQAQITHDLTDDVLQTLFALSMQITALRASLPPLSPEAEAQLSAADAAISRAVQQLYANTAHMRGGS